MADKIIKRDPDTTYSYNGELYGKDYAKEGRSVADLDKIYPNKAISTAPTDAEGNEIAPVNDTPEETGSVAKDGTVQPHESSATPPAAAGAGRLSEEQLEGMSKSELADEAEKRGVVVRGSTKADYVKALK